MFDHPSYASEMAFAVRAAKFAGATVMKYYQTTADVQFKGDGSPVTIADRHAEEVLRGMIESTYPSDGILGEEFGEVEGTSGRRWILDPIDGTRAFMHGVPLFGVLVGMEDKGVAAVGAVFLPALNELVYAALGLGAWWLPAGHTLGDAPQTARVSAAPTLSDGLVLVAAFEYFQMGAREEVFERLIRAGKMRGWSDCYAHVLVATGRAVAAIDPVMKIWDSAPFLPILTEAGGTFTDWGGAPTIAAPEAISTNSRVLHEVLKLVR